ncbi:WD40 repeat domain-containing protein [Helicobacter mesocricetorum]|uniref:WD40 repeat domain-containing protein n=1 Tax=Helicobacter mesocricetorum TaxID=87012 RepID=UPI000CF0DE69|nr:nitrate reductase [Helicobacter mesocricetorum]
MYRILLLLVSVFTFAKTITPSYELNINHNIISMDLIEGRLFVATDFGEVLEINFDQTLKNVKEHTIVKLPNIRGFFDDFYAPKVFSVDVYKDKYLINSEGSQGTKNLFIFDGKLALIFGVENSLNIKKAVFVNEQQIFLGLVSNEILLYDLKYSKVLYRKQLSEARFSDFVLSEDRKYFLSTSESGILYYGKTQDGEILQTFEEVNKDNVYEVKMEKDSMGNITIITAGQDRRVGVYFLDTHQRKQFYIKESEFLVYSVGLSENASRGAYTKNENSDIIVFDIKSKEEIAHLKGHTSLLNSIVFINDSILISSEDGRRVLFWKLP